MPRTRLTGSEIKKWKDEIDLAIRHRDDNFGVYDPTNPKGAGKYFAMFDNKGMFGDSYSDNTGTEAANHKHEAIANQVKPNAKQFIASTYFQNPKILFNSTRKDDELYSPVMEKVINYLYRELGVKEQNEFAIFNAYMGDLGCTEVGYWTEYGKIPVEREKEAKESFIKKIGKAFKKGDPVEYNEFIRWQTPFIRSLWPFGILFPFYIREYRDLPWCGKDFFKDMNFIHNYFHNTGHLKGNTMPNNKLLGQNTFGGIEIDNFKQMKVYWLYIKPGAIDGVEELSSLAFLGNDSGVTEPDPVHFGTLPLPIEGFPLSFLQFNKTQGKIYSTSEVATYADLQYKLNTLFSRAYDLARRYNLKILYNEDAFKSKGMLNKLKDENDVFVGVRGVGSPALAISENRETSKIPPELLKMIEFILTEIRVEAAIPQSVLSGESEAQFATTEKIGAGGQAIRNSKAADRINDFVIEQARKFWMITRKYLPFEEVQKIVGDTEIDISTGEKIPIVWPQFKESWVKGEFDVIIDVGSTQKPNPEKDQINAIKWSEMLVSPETQGALAAEGKRVKVSKVIELIGKSFNQRAENFIEDLPKQGQGQLGMGGGGEAGLGGEGLPPEAGGGVPEVNPEEILAQIGGEV